MRLELIAAGKTVHFVSVNKIDADDTQKELIDRVGFSLLQDQKAVNVWSLMDGQKDDFYVFDRQGNLATYLPMSGEISVNLSTDSGYQNLKSAILEVLEAE